MKQRGFFDLGIVLIVFTLVIAVSAYDEGYRKASGGVSFVEAQQQK